jgi:hypothetical protein
MTDASQRRFMHIISSLDSLCRTVQQCDIQPGDLDPLRHIDATIAEVASALGELREVRNGIAS